MIPPRAQRNGCAHAFVEGDAAHRVLLPQQQIRQTHRGRAGVFIFIQYALAILHAVRNIDQQRRPQICFFFELLDVITILLGPDFPIDVTQIVAVAIFPVL